jgi:aldehyde:ferredoxin oxidoreductase
MTDINNIEAEIDQLMTDSSASVDPTPQKLDLKTAISIINDNLKQVKDQIKICKFEIHHANTKTNVSQLLKAMNSAMSSANEIKEMLNE